jgi:hypothetical protein
MVIQIVSFPQMLPDDLKKAMCFPSLVLLVVG